MARIVGHLSVAELGARYLAQGRTFLEVAEVLAFVPRWVEELAARYNAIGPEALGDQRRRNGRTATLLPEEVLSALAARVQAPPAEGGVWSGPKVAAWIARHLGLAQVPPQRGWEALRRLGWSIQAPRPRHARGRPPPRSRRPSKGAGEGGGWRRRSRKPGRRIPAARSRSGPRTSTASA